MVERFCVYVSIHTVDVGHALAGGRVLEIRDVKAPTGEAACNVATAMAIAETEADPTVRKFVISRVWVGQPSSMWPHASAPERPVIR